MSSSDPMETNLSSESIFCMSPPYLSKVVWIHIYVLSSNIPMGVIISMEVLQCIQLKVKEEGECCNVSISPRHPSAR